jgi:hypothetical protein
MGLSFISPINFNISSVNAPVTAAAYKPVFSDQLSYVNIFQSSLESSH